MKQIAYQIYNIVNNIKMKGSYLNQLDMEPIMKGITKKKIIIKAGAVIITLYRCSFEM